MGKREKKERKGGFFMSYHYLVDIALILVSTKVLGILTKRLQMPQVVGRSAGRLDYGTCLSETS